MFADGLLEAVMKALREGVGFAAAVNLNGLPRGVNHDATFGATPHVLFNLNPQAGVHIVVQVVGELQNEFLAATHA